MKDQILYNFLTGQCASLILDIFGKSLSEFSISTYDLVEIEKNYDNLGFFYEDYEGTKQRLGLYLVEYDKSRWGRSPALHLDFCEHVENSKHRMRATNDQTVTYISNGHRLTEKLSLCKKCAKLISEKTAFNFNGTTFSEFILSIEENEDTKCSTVGGNGYTTNWKQISRAFRQYKGYKCESCGFQIKDTSFIFMQTHHIITKLNNERRNLKCLCVKCHSEVDENHKKQFSSFENQSLLRKFQEYKMKAK